MDWRDRARRQAGVISRRQLARAGVSDTRIDSLVRRRELHELLPAVYSPRPVPSSPRQRMWAAALWSGGVISHRSAATLWRLPMPEPAVVHVTVDDRRFRKPVSHVRLHRVRLGRLHCTRFDGLPVTDRSRTVVDLLRTEQYGAARDLLDRALQQRWVTEFDLCEAVRKEPGRAGNGQLRRLMSELSPGAQAESERRLHTLLRRHEIGGWVAQYPVRLPAGVAYIDVAFPWQRIAIEVDGRRAHDIASGRFESDRIRQNELVALGWRVLRVTWNELTQHPDRVLAKIVQLLAS